MAESLALNTPVLAKSGITTVRPAFIGLDMTLLTVTIVLRPWNGSGFVADGRQLEFTYDATTTPTGQFLLRALNKANLSTNSLENRVMTQIKADHPELAGSVSGAPD